MKGLRNNESGQSAEHRGKVMTEQSAKVRAVLDAIKGAEVEGQSFDETESGLDTNTDDGKMEIHNAVCGCGC